jgi:hypothetical protein
MRRPRLSDAPLLFLAALALALAAALVAGDPVHGGSADRASANRDQVAAPSLDPRAALESKSVAIARQAAPAPASALPPRAIAGRFGGRTPEPRKGIAAAPPPAGPPERADWLRALGGFEDGEGRGWILVKDERAGRAIKLRADGSACAEGRLSRDAAGGLVLDTGSRRFAISGR